MDLDAAEVRVLGCLIEKQRTTPDTYPLTLNALRLACNQATNRDPVVDYDEETIRDALQRLWRKEWARLASGQSSRAVKYRQLVQDTLGPVLELPEPARSDLLKSLAVLSSTRFNVAESARILHYHYNTMRYRVTKLERMLGAFADDAAAALRIGVALQILRMDEISGDTLQTLP